MGRIRGPLSFDQFRQRVSRHPRLEVVQSVAALATDMTRAEHRQGPELGLPNFVTHFALAAIARAALLYGNEHRDRPVSRDDLVDMCDYYAQLEDPALDDDPGRERLRAPMNRIAYEQFSFQYSLMENVGRTVAMLLGRPGRCTNAATAEEWRELLGVRLEEFMRVGFAMYVVGLQNGGRITREVLRMEHVAPIFTPLRPDEAFGVIDRWFGTTLAEHAKVRDREISGREKWSLNPLLVKPIVTVGDTFLMPIPRHVMDRITPTGLYFIALGSWGARFTDSLGCLFERYVEDQLRLLEQATILTEIVYGAMGEKTVDFFVVTDTVIVLVEAKAARPIEATRLGEPASDEDIDRKVGHAMSQINNTARLLADGHPALQHINPNGLPVVGVVVTLEPFHLVNTFVYEDLMGKTEIPLVVASAHEIEGFVAVTRDRIDIGKRLLA